MKTIFTFILFICSTSLFSQFAIITDKDGFTNVRERANTNARIRDTLHNGQIVLCDDEQENGWFPVKYHLEQTETWGYIHPSRLKFVEYYTPVPKRRQKDTLLYVEADSVHVVTTPNYLGFESDSILLNVAVVPFDLKRHRLEYEPKSGPNDAYQALKTIDGKKVWGTDGTVPRTQYDPLLLHVAGKEILLPTTTLYEPSLEYFTVTVDPLTQRIYVMAMNGDGAGAYYVLWVVEKGKYKQRIVTMTP